MGTINGRKKHQHELISNQKVISMYKIMEFYPFVLDLQKTLIVTVLIFYFHFIVINDTYENYVLGLLRPAQYKYKYDSYLK